MRIIFKINELCGIVRYLFYARRKLLQDIVRKLATIYGKVSYKEKSMRKFQLIIIALILITELFSYLFLSFHLYQTYKDYSIKELYFLSVTPPFAAPLKCFSEFLYNWWPLHFGFPSYFCAVCYVLKETLTAFDETLKTSSEEDLQELCEVYCAITATISYINKSLHSLVLATSLVVLTETFLYFFILLTAPNIVYSVLSSI